jgi:hypothetical protein
LGIIAENDSYIYGNVVSGFGVGIVGGEEVQRTIEKNIIANIRWE